MFLWIAVNFFFGKAIEEHREHSEKKARFFFIAGCEFNLSVLLLLKFFAVYGAELSSRSFDILRTFGLSYITFQAISYLYDLKNEVCNHEKSFINFSTYVMMFPKLLIGPIVRYRDIAGQLQKRESDVFQVASGLRRFLIGLAKKVLIADTIGRTIDPAFALMTPNFSTATAWFVLFGYAIQLYYDFSGLTDMAIGLGQMLGFRFVENFNYPYIAKSITEFWRRWHISLSSWFRDYVFFPLEFLRRKSKFFSQGMNIFLVFLLTGLWHGLTLNFLIWGGIHGLALVFEMRYQKKMKNLWAPIQHFYTLVVVLCGWVFFRSNSVDYAVQFFARLFGSQQGLSPLPYSVTQPLPLVNHSVYLALVVGIFFSAPVVPFLLHKWGLITEKQPVFRSLGQLGADGLLLVVGVLSVAAITSMGVSANIYGGF